MGSNIKIDVRKERLQNKNSEDEFATVLPPLTKKENVFGSIPKNHPANFTTWRIVVTVILLSLLFGGPFIKINGQPLLLLNVLERKFIIFGQAFWPQDFVLLAVTLIAFFVFVILFTVVFGRVWCGWLCPQTLFMEMVFRKIEYWIEGDAASQRRLSKEKWNAEKIFKKTS
jgi:polyferredoxin